MTLESVPIEAYFPILVFLFVVVSIVGFSMVSAQKSTAEETVRATRWRYEIPENYHTLAFAERRVVTIKNLHLNYGWDTAGIANLLELDQRFVEDTVARFELPNRKRAKVR